MPSPEEKRLAAIARSYIWWKPPEESLRKIPYLLARVMTYGTLEDVSWIITYFGTKQLKEVLRHPPVGVFNGRSWHFWHYWLGLAKAEGDIPPLPERRITA